MRDLKVLVNGDGVPQEVFGGDTARLDRKELHGLKRKAAGQDDEAIPVEMGTSGDTMRIDSTALVGLIEQSEGIEVAKQYAMGTPGEGLPAFADNEPEIQIEEAAPDVVVAREPSHPIYRGRSRLRDFLIGGSISVIVMASWYLATQL